MTNMHSMKEVDEEKARFDPFFVFDLTIYYWFARMAHITPLFAMHWRNNLNIRFTFFWVVMSLFCFNCATHYLRTEQPNQMFHSISLPFSSQFDANMSFVVAIMFQRNMHIAHILICHEQTSRVCVLNIVQEKAVRTLLSDYFKIGIRLWLNYEHMRKRSVESCQLELCHTYTYIQFHYVGCWECHHLFHSAARAENGRKRME